MGIEQDLIIASSPLFGFCFIAKRHTAEPRTLQWYAARVNKSLEVPNLKGVALS